MLDIPKLRKGDIIEIDGIRFKLISFTNTRFRPPRVVFHPVHIPRSDLPVRVNQPRPR